jgi:hypothetical protein
MIVASYKYKQKQCKQNSPMTQNTPIDDSLAYLTTSTGYLDPSTESRPLQAATISEVHLQAAKKWRGGCGSKNTQTPETPSLPKKAIVSAGVS